MGRKPSVAEGEPAGPVTTKWRPLSPFLSSPLQSPQEGLEGSQNSWMIPLTTNNLGMLLNSFETELAPTPQGSINLQLKLDYVEITLNKEYSVQLIERQTCEWMMRSFSLKGRPFHHPKTLGDQPWASRLRLTIEKAHIPQERSKPVYYLKRNSLGWKTA